MPHPLFLSVVDALRFVSGFTAKNATVDTCNWSFIERRSKDDKCDDVVVFLHGFSSMREAWLRVARGVDKRFSIVIPDLPGHGRTTPSDALSDYSMGTQAERLHKFLENEVPAEKRIHLVGCSMGGMLAGVYAGMYPERVKSLTLVCPAGITMPNKSDLLKMLENSGRNLLLAHTPEDIKEMNKALHFKPVTVPHALAAIIASDRKKQLPVLEKIIGDSLENPIALEELLPNIRAKTLVLWGKHDRVLDVSCVEVLRQQLHPDTQSQVVLIDECGHLVQHEKYAECSAAINKHLADNMGADSTMQGQRAASSKLKQLAMSARQIIPSYRRLQAPARSSYAVQ
ncbi:hypothetical protein PHYSODRAFT_302306 [Phytophthora sojae]|uniref:AB hydrolase-1 domain-containing protein n=1 Tax=Phytophthora sojae (strain P6497) TaxID=1094619 RepID=G4ZQN9_PHYSP|nr:hypothetical protein PHYSODRAFT_302306 [Phytophthora sojae]EGZ15896.1 hypothetical protein PHYSODRAFT_302306 [Phytophthora sojae]|eukprot:XP_009529645.1 hypothetical protein PHYSODRAFT_302306 [Phytophthora sojae]